jgi:hypothetical protein
MGRALELSIDICETAGFDTLGLRQRSRHALDWSGALARVVPASCLPEFVNSADNSRRLSSGCSSSAKMESSEMDV